MIDEAIKTVSQPSGVTAGAFLRSIAFLSEPENDDRVPVSLFLTALQCAAQFGDNITPMRELVALALYRRTGRPRKTGHEPYEDFITDSANWSQYLKENGDIQHHPGP